ncbi:MAG TPA: hypothetical protein VEK75_10230 [Xanthobacteraceae bacterium]|nr:hypothetical protein [Xanthobacteraceae bacterium]
MPEIAYALIAGVVVLFAVIVVLIVTFDARSWIARDLKHGDLHALIDVASGLRPDGLTEGQARRLQARGMVRPYGQGQFRATLKGRLALLIRQFIRRTA